MDYKYQGIILNKREVGEVDRIYTIYTFEAGKIRVLGKGVRKPNAKLAGNLESVTQAEIFMSKNKGMGKITGSIAINNFSNIKSNLDLVNRVFYVFKILARIISEEEKDEKIFLLLEKYLTTMDANEVGEDKADILTLGLLFQILAEMGYRLEMEKCVHCEKKLLLENNYFSISRGGVLCANCQNVENKKILISNEAIKLIRIFLQNRLENLIKLKVPQADINRLKIILNESINWFSGENFRI
ncbi:MAG: DNA repair protein RecO [Candidatus Moranbacteria bacterium]|nr:DNA repair protein RecO [Candidatus Moranbacteria bacterium]